MISFKTKLSFYFLLTVLLFSTAFNLNAQDPPETPLDFEGEVQIVQQDVYQIKLTWTKNPDGVKPDLFYIYFAEGEKSDYNDFEELDTYDVTGNKSSYQYTNNEFEAGTYSFYITSAATVQNEELESDPSGIIILTIEEDEEEYSVEIISAPSTTATIGEEYTYDVEAETDSECAILFEEGKHFPEGMSIEETTGEITWTPEAAGKYQVEVRAYLDCDEDIYDTQMFKINVDGNNNNKDWVRITSKAGHTATIGEEYTYEVEAETNTECGILFGLEGDTPDGMVIDQNSGLLAWTPTEDGKVQFTVRAYLDCDEEIYDDQKVTVQVGKNNNNEKGHVSITSKAEHFLVQDELFEYQLLAESNINCPVLFEIDGESPEGMEIDNNGLLTWTPTETGIYKLWIKAYLECDEEVTDKQRLVFKVDEESENPECAYINGHVEDEEGNLLDGTATAWRVDRESMNNKGKKVFSEDIIDGEFSFYLSEGTYVVRAHSSTFTPEWYNDADNMADAERLELACEETLDLDYILEKIEENNFTVSGSVKSAADDSPIAARVEFLPVEWLYNDNNGKPKKWKYVAMTDESGTYTIELTDEHSYIARASATVSGYSVQYYNMISDPLEADIIELTGDLEGIDFLLSEGNDYSNGFNGHVEEEDGNRLQARLTAYLTEALDNTGFLGFVSTVDTDEDGNFEFRNLVPGNYSVFSIPTDKVFVPGYYTEDGLVTKKWKDAGSIFVEDAVLGDDFVLIHEERSGMKGIANAKGQVKKKGENNIKISDGIQSGGEAVTGAFVYITDAAGDVARFSFTDNEGSFEFEDAEPGSYTITADKIGLEPASDVFDIDYWENYEVDVSLDLTEQTSGIRINDGTTIKLSVYPCPAADQFRLNFISAEPRVRLSITNSAGIVVSEKEYNLTHGLNEINQDTENFASGIYIIKLKMGEEVYTRELLILK